MINLVDNKFQYTEVLLQKRVNAWVDLINPHQLI